jgi:3-isopropylmalate/(R)-2-methylmalate dehydratase small subunit
LPEREGLKQVQGRILALTGADNRLIDDIDTDQIFHNRHLAMTDPAATGTFAFGNLPGWEDFSARVGPGDILLAGANFGCGSSRQQAVDCFLSLEVGALMARSFAPIYYRNAINAALPVIVCSGLASLLESGLIGNGDFLVIDFSSGEIRDQHTGAVLVRAEPVPQIQLDIHQAGGLMNYGLGLK